jgi:hypothetical protein
MLEGGWMSIFDKYWWTFFAVITAILFYSIFLMLNNGVTLKVTVPFMVFVGSFAAVLIFLRTDSLIAPKNQSESILTTEPIDSVVTLSSVERKLEYGLYEVRVAYSLDGAWSTSFDTAIYVGENPRKSEEVELIKVGQSAVSPDTNNHSWLLLARPRESLEEAVAKNGIFSHN